MNNVIRCGDFTFTLPDECKLVNSLSGSLVKLFKDYVHIDLCGIEVTISGKSEANPSDYLTDFYGSMCRGGVKLIKKCVNGITYEHNEGWDVDYIDLLCSFHGERFLALLSCQAEKITEMQKMKIDSLINSVKRLDV